MFRDIIMNLNLICECFICLGIMTESYICFNSLNTHKPHVRELSFREIIWHNHYPTSNQVLTAWCLKFMFLILMLSPRHRSTKKDMHFWRENTVPRAQFYHLPEQIT